MASPTSSSLVVQQQRDPLLEAIGDFQAALSDGERHQLKNMGAVPNADNIMVFTAELDSIHRKRTGPSYASRLHTVLSSVGVFCSVVDTFVSSHPEIAALVWGGVKLTMMVAANVASYYQPTSDLFMKLGRLCPLFSDYQALYPGSIRLQGALVNFHASIVRCCGHVLKTLRRPLHQHLFSSLLVSFGQEFKPDLDEIQRYSDSVMQEIQFAKAQADRQDQQLQVIERQEALRNRTLMGRFTTRTDDTLRRLHEMQMQREERSTRERKQQLLDSLSTRDYLRLFKQNCRKRWHKTTSWLFQTSEFCSWIDGERPVLWCSGKIGSGKTIATASVIQHVLRCKGPSSGSVSYYFVQSTSTRPSNANEILKSILQQRLDSTHVTDQVEILLRQLYDLQDTVKLLRQSIPSSTSYIIIDGIDECQMSERRELMAVLSSLISRNGNIRLFLCGRISIRDEIKAHFSQSFHLSLDCDATSRDIAHYINSIIDSKIEDGDFCVGDPDLVDKVKLTLADGAQGMFLWAHFQIQEIICQPSDASIRAALDNLPKDLSEMFNRVLQRIRDGSHIEEARRVFRWVAAAKRPLFLKELREAIAIRTDQQFSEPARHCNDMNKIAKWCENLVEAEEESEVVQFVHHSVQTFLLGNHTETSLADFHVNLDQADCKLGRACLTYLDFNDFKRSLITQQQQPLPISNPIGIVNATAKPGSTLSKVYRRIAKPGPETFDLRRSIDPDGSAAIAQTSRTITYEYPFLKYASVHWLSHTKRLRKSEPKSWAILRLVVSGNLNFAHLPWKSDPQDQNDALQWAKDNRHYAILQALWSDTTIGLMRWAAENSVPQLFDILYEDMGVTHHNGRVDTPEYEPYSCYLKAVGIFASFASEHDLKVDTMVAAASRGHFHVMNEMLSWDISPETKGTSGVSAWEAAAQGGQVKAVELLLLYRPKVKFGDALPLAAGRSHSRTVDRLLEAGADIDGRVDYGTALAEAATAGHFRTVKRLLRLGADVHGASSWDSPLTRAVKGGHLMVVDILLAAGADDVKMPVPAFFETKNYEANNTKIHLRLLDHEVKLSERAGRPRTMLHVASNLGRLDEVVMLLRAGVKADAVDQEGRTALHIATSRGFKDIVFELCRAESSILHTTDQYGDTALHIAARDGGLCGEIFKFLCHTKIDKEAKNLQGKTAMDLCI